MFFVIIAVGGHYVESNAAKHLLERRQTHFQLPHRGGFINADGCSWASGTQAIADWHYWWPMNKSVLILHPNRSACAGCESLRAALLIAALDGIFSVSRGSFLCPLTNQIRGHTSSASIYSGCAKNRSCSLR
jgi:hypothetical protein